VNNSEIYEIIHTYVVFATGLPVADVRPVRDNYNIEPIKDRGTIVTIGLINSTPIGMDQTFYENIEGDDLNVNELVSADRNLTASIKVDGDDAEDIANKIAWNTARSGASEIFYNGEIGFIRKGEIINLSELLNGGYNEIRQIDIEFHINHVDALEVNAINSSTIDVELQGSGTLTETIEVTQ
jgi:hypothetical protein